jgi:hypothetical protein
VSWVQHPEVYLDTSSWENLQSDWQHSDR